MAREAWSAQENRETVEAYLQMLLLDLREVPYRKTEVVRDLMAVVPRSRGAIEYKFGNISAALAEVGHPWVGGFAPYANLQARLRDEVYAGLARHPEVARAALEAVSTPVRESKPAPAVDFRWHETSPPQVASLPDPAHRERMAVKRDYARIEADNRLLGRQGEEHVVRLEQQRLRQAHRHDLADRVEHVSDTQGDGLGFDILSFDPDSGDERFLEVKTTKRGKEWPILVSSGEVGFSAENPAQFVLVRVHDLRPGSARVYRVPGPLTATFVLDPVTYRGLPRAS